jgi:nucleoside phosphorylase
MPKLILNIDVCGGVKTVADLFDLHIGEKNNYYDIRKK